MERPPSLKPLYWVGSSKRDLRHFAGPSQSRGADRQGVIPMKKQRVVRGIPIEQGSGNVYADLGYADSESMLVKAELAAKIAEIIRRRALTQTDAAKILGLTQPKVSALLKGRFRGISEHRLLECLT